MFSVSAACSNKCIRRLVPQLKKQVWAESDLSQTSEVRFFLRGFTKVLPFGSKELSNKTYEHLSLTASDDLADNMRSLSLIDR